VNDSVFHKGEIDVQTRVGVAERIGQVAPRMIRDHMPEQHRKFYTQLPFILVGHLDQSGQVWASILTGAPGFIQSPVNTRLSIAAQPVNGDPLQALFTDAKVGQPARLGLLGIELETRRRNRINGELSRQDDQGFEINVTQTFGNCPKYIQVRDVELIDPSSQPKPTITEFDHFSPEVAAIISNSDTFFVASTNQQAQQGDTISTPDGADVSHRGGQPGFVKVGDDNTLIVPDYVGNSMFNTLGNFSVNPNAGLLFIDFNQGHLITLTGRAEILWDSTDVANYEGAERLWQFTLTNGKVLRHAIPLRARLS